MQGKRIRGEGRREGKVRREKLKEREGGRETDFSARSTVYVSGKTTKLHND